MTEAEWLAATELYGMLNWLRDAANERKLRLFASECFRRMGRALPDSRQHRAVETLSELAEGTATHADRSEASRHARQACYEFPSRIEAQFDGTEDDLHFVGLMLYREFASRWIGHHASMACGGLVDGAAEQSRQHALLRDIFGNPFRTVTFAPEWRTDTAVSLARTMYDQREFSAMPILADALQDAGCDNHEILTHCREDGMHVRGCWVVDLVLGKA